jgi:hypothetical protein
MSHWIVLSRSEGRRGLRLVERLARQNPVVLLALAAGAAAVPVLAGRAGRETAVIAQLGFGVAFLLLPMGTAALIGLLTSASAPRFEDLDEQVEASPLRPLEAFLGATGVPLVLAWSVIALPIVAFGFALFRELHVPDPLLWSGLLLAAQLAATLTGAVVAETARADVTLRGRVAHLLPFLVSLVAIAGAVRYYEAPVWSWLAGLFPLDASTPRSLGITGSVLALALALTAWTWIGLAVGPGRRRSRSGRVRSQPMGQSLLEAVSRWLALRAIRDGRVRVQAALAIAFGLVAAAVLAFALDLVGALLVPFIAVTLTMAAASVPLALSDDLYRSSWLLRTVSWSTRRVALSWAVGTTLVGMLVAVAALAPLAFAYRLQLAFLLVLMVIAAPIPAAVGRLLPWRSESIVAQLASALALVLLYATALSGTLWLSERAGSLFGGPPWPILGLGVGVAAVWAGAAAICAFAPWRQA